MRPRTPIGTPQAIVIGACVIAVSIWLVNSTRPVQAYANGPFQLSHHSNSNANAGVFRLDTSTGEVSYCYLPGTGNQLDVTCSRAVR